MCGAGMYVWRCCLHIFFSCIHTFKYIHMIYLYWYSSIFLAYLFSHPANACCVFYHTLMMYEVVCYDSVNTTTRRGAFACRVLKWTSQHLQQWFLHRCHSWCLFRSTRLWCDTLTIIPHFALCRLVHPPPRAHTLLLLLLHQLAMLPAWIAYAVACGTAATGAWVVAHECGHGAFSNNRKLQDAVGFVLHVSPCWQEQTRLLCSLLFIVAGEDLERYSAVIRLFVRFPWHLF